MEMNRSRNKKQGQKAIDDVLGDLLAEDLDFATSKSDKGSKGGKKSTGKDDDFYSTLASTAGQPDESDISEADVNKMAESLADLDDLDADLFGGKYNKKKTGSTTPRQRTPRTPRGITPPAKGGLARSSTPTSPPGSATGSHPPDRGTQPVKPSTAPGSIADLTRDSATLQPGDVKQDRPRTVPKAKPKFKFGEFDEDDPLAGLLSDEDEDLDEAKTTNNKVKGDNLKDSKAETEAVLSPRGSSVPRGVEDRDPIVSPRRKRLMDRPPTRSGDNNGTSEDALDRLFEPATETGLPDFKAENKVAKKKDDVIFSDTEDDLLNELEDKTPIKPKPTVSEKDEDHKPAKSVLDSLLGKDTVAKELERPSSGTKKEFVLDSKYQKSQEEKDDDFLFGSYMPSMAGSTAGSRPTSRRSVRFEGNDDILGKPPSRGEGNDDILGKPPSRGEGNDDILGKPPSRGEGNDDILGKPPSRGEGSVKSSGLDWLELASKGDTSKTETPAVKKSPEKSKPTGNNLDWLGLKDSDPDEPSDWLSSGPPKTPISKKILEQDKPDAGRKSVPDIPKPATITTPSKSLYDEDAYSFLHDQPTSQPIKSQTNQPIKQQQKQPASPSKQKKADDWLGLNSSSPESSAPERSPTPERQFNMHKGRRPGIVLDQADLADFKGKASAQGQSGFISESSPTPPTVTVDQLMGVASPSPSPIPTTSFKTSRGPSSAIQQQIEDTQRQLQMQLEEQLRLQKQEEEVALQQEQTQLADMMSQLQQQYQANQLAKSTLMGVGSTTSHGLLPAHQSLRLDPNYRHMDLETKVKRLEIEVECLEAKCGSNQRLYQEELVAMETSYKNRIKVLEDTRRGLEDRLSEESENLLAKHLRKVRDLEADKQKMVEKMEQMEKDKREELERVRESQRKMVADLKREYEDSINRLRAVKNQEIDNITNAHSAAKSLQVVMQQVSSNAKDLGDLQFKVDTWNKMGLDEREIFIRTKDEQLTMLQSRLDKQQEENAAERVRLQELITRLERQLADQGRALEEEKWKVKQEQSRLQSAQNSLEEERRVWVEQQSHEVSALDKAKDSLLKEQKMILSQLYEERRSMAEERSQLAASQRLLREREQQQAIKYVKADAEYEVTMKTVQEERSRHESRKRELEKAEEQLRTQQASLERERYRIEQDQSRLSEMALQVKSKAQEVDDLALSASRTEEEGRSALDEARKLESDHHNHQSQIQSQLQSLRMKEKEIAEERVYLAREKKEVEDLRRSMLCVNCRTPVRDIGLNPPLQHINGYSGSPSGPHYSTPQRTPSGVPIFSPLPTDVLSIRPGVQVSSNAVHAISASIEADKSVRLWKIQAEKDKEYLMEESMFLETLKQSPYSNTRLTS